VELAWEAPRLALRGLLAADAAWVERVVAGGLPHAVPGAAVGPPHHAPAPPDTKINRDRLTALPRIAIDG
jgi:hypothetical protein